jgi:hypothetical protein
VAKNEDFGLQCHPDGNNPVIAHQMNPKSSPHWADYQPIREMTSAVEFPVGTGLIQGAATRGVEAEKGQAMSG